MGAPRVSSAVEATVAGSISADTPPSAMGRRSARAASNALPAPCRVTRSRSRLRDASSSATRLVGESGGAEVGRLADLNLRRSNGPISARDQREASLPSTLVVSQDSTVPSSLPPCQAITVPSPQPPSPPSHPAHPSSSPPSSPSHLDTLPLSFLLTYQANVPSPTEVRPPSPLPPPSSPPSPSPSPSPLPFLSPFVPTPCSLPTSSSPAPPPPSLVGVSFLLPLSLSSPHWSAARVRA